MAEPIQAVEDAASRDDVPTRSPAPSHGVSLRRFGPRRLQPVWVATTLGGIWGAVSFNVLWGYTSIQLTRRFVDSLPGLLSLMPIRVVLYSIRLVEDHILQHSVSFPRNHRWIGVAAIAAGVLIAAAAFCLGRFVARRIRARLSLRPPPVLDPDRPS